MSKCVRGEESRHELRLGSAFRTRVRTMLVAYPPGVTRCMRTGAHLALTCLLTDVLRAYSSGATRCLRTGTHLLAYRRTTCLLPRCMCPYHVSTCLLYYCCTRQVHVGSREFEHLRDYDMNALCARVVVTGTRPAAGS